MDLWQEPGNDEIVMTWNEFIYFGISAVVLSVAGAVFSSIQDRRRIPVILISLAIAVLCAFIAGLWHSLGRPPLKTMGETRLWYSLFALTAGLFTYLRWKYKWILPFSSVLATVFILINILKPEIHDKTLMPALQSPWFIPHVTLYMFSYSFAGCAFLLGMVSVFLPAGKKDGKLGGILESADTLVYLCMAFMTFGLLSGALWAKDAWGHYWSWDPKETWAAVTWLSYMLYMHLRLYGYSSRKMGWLLIFSFACLQMCWWGVNYLPAAQDSIHVYGR